MSFNNPIPIIVMSIIWGLVGILGPFVVPRGPNKGVIQTCLILTAVCCYIFWLVVYLSQLNPLLGPLLDNKTIVIMQNEWGKST